MQGGAPRAQKTAPVHVGPAVLGVRVLASGQKHKTKGHPGLGISDNVPVLACDMVRAWRGETVLVRETARNVHCRSGQGHLDTPVSFLCPPWTEGVHPPFRVRALVWERPMPTVDPT